MKRVFFLFTVWLVCLVSFSQQLSEKEQELYNLIMAYRAEHNLPLIPLSPSLTIVAQTHAKDLAENKPFSEECNLHSWSGKGTWTPCCYTSSNASCMWDKPRELTSYPGHGFEIAAYMESSLGHYEITAQDAIQIWKESIPHYTVILNRQSWEKLQWNAIGIGMYKGFATVWFGLEKE